MPKQLDTLKDYYGKLLAWEGATPCELIAEWPQWAADSIESDIRQAFAVAPMKGTRFALKAGSENQSIGNQMALYFLSVMGPALADWKLSNCPGSGYPDLMLSTGDCTVAVEIKATSEWSAKDRNRIVLTSSSKKLRARFRPPVHHLLVTVQYAKVGPDEASVLRLRLDFLCPATLVNIRFEGSVSQKLLSEASHRTAFME